MALLLWESYDALLASQRWKLVFFGTLSGVLFSAWLLTAYYMAWFFAFFAFFLLAILVVRGGRPLMERLRIAVRNNRISLLIVAAISAWALLPFLLVYLPKARETGMRSFADGVGTTLAIKDIVNVGGDNYLYGHFYTSVVKALCPACDLDFGEMTTGVAPLVLVLLCCSVVWLWRVEMPPRRQAFLRGVALATLITWLLCLRVGTITGWYLIYHVFPGAKALRVVSRYQIFLMAPIVALVACYLAALAQRIPKPILLTLCGVLLLGELNSGASETAALDRRAELERVSVDPPPRGCQSFFVSPARDQDSSSMINAVYPHNVDAMMIAELVHLPTINGLASFNPPDWDFAYPNNADYVERVEKYATLHKLTGLCRLDLATMRWQQDWHRE